MISSLLDVAGGAMALIGAFDKHQHLSQQERMQRLSKLGTIDLRVDYLRPGRGQLFTATAVLLRSGNKVAVVRSELHSDDGTLVAVGTGTICAGRSSYAGIQLPPGEGWGLISRLGRPARMQSGKQAAPGLHPGPHQAGQNAVQ